MKKHQHKKHFLSYLITPVVVTLLTGIGVSTYYQSTQYKKSSVVNDNEFDRSLNSNDTIIESKEQHEDIAKILSQSTFSKPINVSLNYSNTPFNTSTSVTYVNGYNKPILTVSIDHNNNIIASSPNPIRIETINNFPIINNDNFNISLTTYPNNPYGIGGDNGYKLLKPTVNNLNWKVENQTYLNPYDNNKTQASNYVEFTSLGPTPQIIGNVNNGYAELKVHVALPKIPPKPSTTNDSENDIDDAGTYFGPNIIDIQKSNNYSSFLGIKNRDAQEVIIDDTIVFTKLSNKNIIYSLNDDTGYNLITSSLASSNAITASEYLANRINTLSFDVSGVYHNNNTKDNESITPKVYGYADDLNGTLSIVTFLPYLIKKGQNQNIFLTTEKPQVFTLTGFKKSNSAINSKTLVLNSNKINFNNHSTKKEFMVDVNGDVDLNYGFALSPLSLFDFSIENYNLVTKPTTNSYISDQLMFDNFFTNNDKLNWDLIGSNKAFSENNNGSSISLTKNSDFNKYFNNFVYGNRASQLLSAIITTNSLNIKNNPLSNIFNIQDAYKYPGPWVMKPSDLEVTSSLASQYVNYIKFLKSKNIFDKNQNLFNQKISLQTLNDQNRYIQIKQIFGTSLPSLKNAAFDINEYFDLLKSFNVKNDSNQINVNKYKDNKLIFYENGPVILSASDSASLVDAPYLLDGTSVFTWNDTNGISHLSFENNSIFSSYENYQFNLNNLANKNFGSTTFSYDTSNNAGLGDVSGLLPSDVINNSSLYSKLKIDAYNCLLANNDNTQIKLEANDQLGTLTVTVNPYLVTNLDPQFKNYMINSKQQFDQLNSKQLATLLNSSISIDNNNYYSFVIEGFNKLGDNSKPNIEEGWQNDLVTYPLEAFVTSSILGTDLEANLEKFKSNLDDYKTFESFIVADALNRLKEEKLIYFSNPNSSDNNLIDSNGQLNLNNFNNIISKINLFSSDKYNEYVYDVWFKPNTLSNFNGISNNQDVQIRITISTTGQKYTSWVSNNYIMTGLSDAYEAKGIANPIPDKVSPVEFVNNFGQILTKKDDSQHHTNLARFYQNGHYESANNSEKPNGFSITLNPTSNDSWSSYEIFPYRTAPIIFGYRDNYGFDYSALGQILGQNYSTSIQDFSNWNFSYSKVNNINNNVITISYEPKIWMENGKFVTNGLESKNIIFGEVLNSEGLNTSLDSNNINAYDTNMTPHQIYQAILNGPGNVIYDKYLERIKNKISNKLPDTERFPNISGETKVELRVPEKYKYTSENDPNASQATKEAWMQAQKDGNFQIDVYISGWYFENSDQPTNNSQPILLGTVNIINLKSSKITRFNNNFIIPDIMQYGLKSNLSEYLWLRALDSSKKGVQWASIRDLYQDSNNEAQVSLFNETVTQGLIIDGYYSQSDAMNNTKLSINTAVMTIDNVNNAKGTIQFNRQGIKYVGSYYDAYGNKRQTDGIFNEFDITLNGFEKVMDEKTTISNNQNIKIESLLNTPVSAITENEIRNILLANNILKNYPSIKYDNLGLDKTDADLIEINITNRDVKAGTISFTYKIKSVITDAFLESGTTHSKKIIAISGIDYFDQLNSQEHFFIEGSLTFSGFEQVANKVATTIDVRGFKSENFANLIATNSLITNNITLNQVYTESNPFIKTIINSLVQYNVINNVPKDFNSSNVYIKVVGVDNVKGSIKIAIGLDKYLYRTNSGEIVEYDKVGTPVWNEVDWRTSIQGFKTIAGETTLKQPNSHIISTSMKPADLNDANAWKQIIFNLAPSIFENIPITSSTPSNNDNNPVITINDIIVQTPIVTDNENTVTIGVELNSYYQNDQTWNTPVWVKNNQKSFGSVIFTSLNNKTNTAFVTDIYLDSTDINFINQVPSTIATNSSYEVSLAELIIKKGLTGRLPENLNVNNVKNIVFEKVDNLNGKLTIQASLNTYYENGTLVEPNQTKLKSGTIIINNFKSIKPTSIIRNYNGALDDSINPKFAYQYSETDIKNLLFNKLIVNTTNDFSINDIKIENINYRNDIGVVSFEVFIKNYFNQEGNIVNTLTSFDYVTISGFKTVQAFTTISNINYIQDEIYRKSLAISFFNYVSNQDIRATDLLKQYILTNMVNNGPDLTNENIEVSGINVNNITGTIKATIKLNKYIDNKFNIIDTKISSATPLTTNIAILGFMSVGETSIASQLFIDQQYQSQGAIEFVNADTNHKLLKDFIFKNIQNKWNSSKDANQFTDDDFDLYNIDANNINGTITLQVGLKRYIDNDGQYYITNVGQYPKLITVTIKGFKQVGSSMIEDSYIIPNQEKIYAYNYQSNEAEFETTIKQIILNNLLINKTDATTADDLKIVSHKAYNNFGTIEVEVEWNKNFIDYAGNNITNVSSNPIKQKIVFSGFKQMNAATSVKQNIDIRSDATMANKMPSEYALATIATSQVSEEQIKDIIIKNLSNDPQHYDNETKKYITEITREDIHLIKKQMSDGREYWGTVNNFFGTLIVEFAIDKYFSDTFEYVNAAIDESRSPKILNTTLTGFSKTNKLPTIINSPLDVSINGDISSNVDDWNYIPEGLSYREQSAKDFLPNQNFKYVLLKSGKFQNWTPLNKILGNENGNWADENAYHQALKKVNQEVLQSLYSKINVTKVSYDDTNAYLEIKLLDWVSPDDGIYVNNSFSKPYYLTVSGFKNIQETSFNGSINLNNIQLKQDLSSYSHGTLFSNINVFNLTDNDINIIVQSELNKIVNYQTSTVQNIANSDFYLTSNFSNYFKIDSIERNGYGTPANGGSITIKIALSSYYNQNHNEINENINDAANPIVGDVVLSGFMRTPKTIVKQFVNVDGQLQSSYQNVSPNEFFNQPSNLKQMILDNQALFFDDLPSAESFDLNTSLKITPISFDNINGSVQLKISLSAYFSDYGEYINNNGPLLSKEITISGLKQTRPTSIVNNIDIQKLGIKATNLENINNINFVNEIKQKMYLYQNRNADLNQNDLIWNNLPNEYNGIDINQFNISVDNNSINFANGTVRINVSMNSYYNDDGILVNDQEKTFNTTLTNFDIVPNQTSVSELASSIGKGIDLKSTVLSKYTIEDFQNNISYLSLLQSNITDTMMKQMFDNLPTTANPRNIKSISISDKQQSDPMKGILYLDIVLDNWFKKENNAIIQCYQDSPVFTIKFSGLQKIAVTTVNNLIDISSLPLKLDTLAGINASKLNLFLNDPSFKKTIINNPVLDQTDGTIKTNIDVLPIDNANIDAPNGVVKVNIKLINNYQKNSEGKISINESYASSTIFKNITIFGFDKLPVTTCEKNPVINYNGTPENASVFASNKDKLNKAEIIQLINKEKTNIFEKTGANTIEILDIINPNINSVQQSQTSKSKNKIYIDDIAGEIKLKILYTGGYNQSGKINETPMLSSVITIKGFIPKAITQWKKNANVATIDGVQTLTIFDEGLANVDVNNSLPPTTFTNLIRDNLVPYGSEDLVFQKMSEWVRNEKEGTISTNISILNWKQIDNSTDTIFNSNSTFVSSNSKSIRLVISGYKKVDLEITQRNMIIILSVTGGLVALILAVIICIFAFRRRIF